MPLTVHIFQMNILTLVVFRAVNQPPFTKVELTNRRGLERGGEKGGNLSPHPPPSSSVTQFDIFFVVGVLELLIFYYYFLVTCDWLQHCRDSTHVSRMYFFKKRYISKNVHGNLDHRSPMEVELRRDLKRLLKGMDTSQGVGE